MKKITAAIITIGDELLIGQTIDTNSSFIARELNKCGIWMKRCIRIGDDEKEITNALALQSADNDIIIITGGLGPTADDITKPALCRYFGGRLVENESVLRNIEHIFQKINRPVTQTNRLQAMVPDNCTVLQNERGTAPGMWFNREGVIYISLPGVPHEMKGLMINQVIPKLKKHFTLPCIVHHTLLIAGKAESDVSDLLSDYEQQLPKHIKLAYLPAFSLVRLRLTGMGNDRLALEAEVAHQGKQLASLVQPWLVAEEDITLQEVTGRLLRSMNKTVITAESCTGGYIASLITSVGGSSAYYKGSVVAYANDLKMELLHVAPETIARHGAVSEQTITEMAEGALKSLKADYVIATSGIMGPSGGSPEKPAGTVWIAVGNRETIHTSKFFFRFDRQRNIELTAHTALNLLRKFLLEEEKTD